MGSFVVSEPDVKNFFKNVCVNQQEELLLPFEV